MMINLKNVALLCAAAGFAFACQQTGNDSEGKDLDTMAYIEEEVFVDDDHHNAANSLDYFGTYTGVLPCADCEGIETIIVINSDSTYHHSARYLGKDDGPFVTEGTWEIDRSTLKLDKIDNAFFVGENHLVQLDLDGKRVEGDLAEYYVLKK